MKSNQFTCVERIYNKRDFPRKLYKIESFECLPKMKQTNREYPIIMSKNCLRCYENKNQVHRYKRPNATENEYNPRRVQQASKVDERPQHSLGHDSHNSIDKIKQNSVVKDRKYSDGMITDCKDYKSRSNKNNGQVRKFNKSKPTGYGYNHEYNPRRMTQTFKVDGRLSGIAYFVDLYDPFVIREEPTDFKRKPTNVESNKIREKLKENRETNGNVKNETYRDNEKVSDKNYFQLRNSSQQHGNIMTLNKNTENTESRQTEIREESDEFLRYEIDKLLQKLCTKYEKIKRKKFKLLRNESPLTMQSKYDCTWNCFCSCKHHFTSRDLNSRIRRRYLLNGSHFSDINRRNLSDKSYQNLSERKISAEKQKCELEIQVQELDVDNKPTDKCNGELKDYGKKSHESESITDRSSNEGDKGSGYNKSSKASNTNASRGIMKFDSTSTEKHKVASTSSSESDKVTDKNSGKNSKVTVIHSRTSKKVFDITSTKRHKVADTSSSESGKITESSSGKDSNLTVTYSRKGNIIFDVNSTEFERHKVADTCSGESDTLTTSDLNVLQEKDSCIPNVLLENKELVEKKYLVHSLKIKTVKSIKKMIRDHELKKYNVSYNKQSEKSKTDISSRSSSVKKEENNYVSAAKVQIASTASVDRYSLKLPKTQKMLSPSETKIESKRYQITNKTMESSNKKSEDTNNNIQSIGVVTYCPDKGGNQDDRETQFPIRVDKAAAIGDSLQDLMTTDYTHSSETQYTGDSSPELNFSSTVKESSKSENNTTSSSHSSTSSDELKDMSGSIAQTNNFQNRSLVMESSRSTSSERPSETSSDKYTTQNYDLQKDERNKAECKCRLKKSSRLNTTPNNDLQKDERNKAVCKCRLKKSSRFQKRVVGSIFSLRKLITKKKQ